MTFITLHHPTTGELLAINTANIDSAYWDDGSILLGSKTPLLKLTFVNGKNVSLEKDQAQELYQALITNADFIQGRSVYPEGIQLINLKHVSTWKYLPVSAERKEVVLVVKTLANEELCLIGDEAEAVRQRLP